MHITALKRLGTSEVYRPFLGFGDEFRKDLWDCNGEEGGNALVLVGSFLFFKVKQLEAELADSKEDPYVQRITYQCGNPKRELVVL